jgi:hypothetical protein
VRTAVGSFVRKFLGKVLRQFLGGLFDQLWFLFLLGALALLGY